MRNEVDPACMKIGQILLVVVGTKVASLHIAVNRLFCWNGLRFFKFFTAISLSFTFYLKFLKCAIWSSVTCLDYRRSDFLILYEVSRLYYGSSLLRKEPLIAKGLIARIAMRLQICCRQAHHKFNALKYNSNLSLSIE